MSPEEAKEALTKILEKKTYTLNDVFTIVKCISIAENISLLEAGKRYLANIPSQSKYGYPRSFNEELKSRIRKRDNSICQLCGRPQKNHHRKLFVHHITYNKKITKTDKLTTLCNSCNSGVNRNREDWKKYFLKKPIYQQPLPLYLCYEHFN